MDITIGAMVVVMKARGIESSLALTVVMGIPALVSLSLFLWLQKNLKSGQ